MNEKSAYNDLNKSYAKQIILISLVCYASLHWDDQNMQHITQSCDAFTDTRVYLSIKFIAV